MSLGHMTVDSDRLTREDDLDIASFESASAAPTAYTSPLLARMSGQGKLTIELLRNDVPIFKAGEEAQAALNDPDVKHTSRQRAALAEQVQRGEDAKERLVIAAIPLIKHLAKKEHQRRQHWQSQVPYEDLVQEGVAGFMQGLRAYNVDGAQRSPTNYLGQWILTVMRRNVEATDNDFGVAFDAAERFRKIRAVRARLTSELHRDPTDEEVLVASNDEAYRGGQKMGRVNKKPVSARRQLTQAQLDEEREARSRVGFTARFASSANSEQYEGPNPELGRSVTSDRDVVDDHDRVLEDGAQEGLARLLNETFLLMGLPDTQREVISRRFGLPPHTQEFSARDISRDMNLHRERVGKVIETFTEEMARKGGPFHRACGQWSTDDLLGLGLGWTLTVLGPWSAQYGADPGPVPEILTTPLVARRGSIAPPKTDTSAMTGEQVSAQFACDYHGWGFVATYPNRKSVPNRRACPQCGRPSELTRVAVADV